ncbi:hypothetical protein ABPG77_002415 [Micractinium sp. CCAP 211/92]
MTLPARQLEKGIVGYGDRARARRAFSKLMRGEPITAAVLGGSVTFGQGARQPGVTDYASRALAWINATFPHPGHVLVRSGVGGAISSYFALCTELHMPSDADLVILEFAVNDVNPDHRRGHERLIRKLLAFPRRPAVVEMVHYRQPWAPSAPEVPFRWMNDDENAIQAAYYRLPHLAVRSLVWGQMQVPRPEQLSGEDPNDHLHGYPSVDDIPGGRFSFMYLDAFGHPNEQGHRWISELVIHWMQRQLEDLAARPLGPEDEQEAREDLPPPLYPNNTAPATSACYVGEVVQQLVVAKDAAWEWKHEGAIEKKKFGFISELPGSSLTLQVNTSGAPASSGGGASADNTTVAVTIAFLRSYEHMGHFMVECTQGCSCEPLRLDGIHKLDNSLLSMESLQATRSDACRLRVTVLPDTSSPDKEHKVKILGLIVSDQPPRELSDAFMSWSLSQARDGVLSGQQAAAQQVAGQVPGQQAAAQQVAAGQQEAAQPQGGGQAAGGGG